jgi:SHS family lactate transporter-like MFS transporter
MSERKNTSKVPVLIAGVIGWAHDGYALVLVSLLATTISVAYGVDKIAIGFVFSAQYVMTVFGAAFFGELADRFGRKNILLLSVLWDSVFTSLSAFAPTFEIFALLRLISGLGVSWGISFSLLSETFSSKKRGFAGGLVHATFVVGYIGAVIVVLIFGDMAPIVLGPLALEGWRICFLSALFPVPFLIYLEFKLDESQVWTDYKKATQDEGEIKSEKVRILDIFKGKWAKFTLLLILLFWLSEFAYHTLSDWAPTYFEYLFTYELQNAGGNVDSAGTLAMVVMLGVMVIAAFALATTGYLSDRIGRRNAFIGCSVVGLIGASLFFFANFIFVFTPLIVIGCLVLTVSFGMHGVFGVWSSEIFPTRIRATATSLIFSVARGLAWGAFLVGIIAEALQPSVPLLSDPFGHAQALAVAMLACTFAYIAMLFVPRLIPETKGIDIASIEE